MWLWNIQKYLIKRFSVLAVIVVLTACTRSEDPLSQSDSQGHFSATSSAELNVQLGINYLQRKNIPMAKASLLKALKYAPKSPEAWYAMAYFLEVTGDREKAEADYRHAIQVAPKSGDAHNNYGTFLCRQGRYHDAVQEFMVAASTSDYIDVSGAYENAGLCALLIPDKQAAVTYFSKALSNDPNHPTSLLQLAKLYYQQGDIEKSRDYLLQFEKLSNPTEESQQLEAQIMGGPNA